MGKQLRQRGGLEPVSVLDKLMARLASRAYPNRVIVWVNLQYRFLGFVVHAPLAKVVNGLFSAGHFFEAIRKRSRVRLVKIIAGAVNRLCSKLGNLGFKLANTVFQHALRVDSRRSVLLQLNADACHVDDSLRESVSGGPDEGIVTRFERTAQQVSRGRKARKCTDDVHTSSPCVISDRVRTSDFMQCGKKPHREKPHA